jgi:hypothetical protein
VGFVLIEALLVWSSVASLKYKRNLVTELMKVEREAQIAAMIGGRRRDDQKPVDDPRDPSA